MKKLIKASVMLSIICLPMLLMFSTVDNHIGFLNFVGAAYTYVVVKFYKKIFPKELIKYLNEIKDC